MKPETQHIVKKYLMSIALIGSIGLTACQPDKVTEKVPQKVSVNEQMNSDELTNAAEQLVGPYTFMLAYKTALLAVEKDPTNLKAQFYLKLLKRFEAFRGVYSRIRPVLDAEQLKALDKYTKDFPESPLKTFFLDNKTNSADIKNVNDMQSVLGEYYTAVADFRKFLKDNQNTELVIYLNPQIFEQEIKKELANSCQYIQKPDGAYDVECSMSQIATKKLNIADLIGLRQMTAMELVYSFLNSYSLEGVQTLSKIDPNGHMSNQARTEYLANLSTFGKLRPDQTLKLMKEMGSDLSVGIKWAQQYQKDICPKGTSTAQQRRGYLFSSGICLEKDSEGSINQFLAVLDRALGGVTRIELTDSINKPTFVNLDIFAWSRSPIQDLKQIKPTSWNNCGDATNFADNTLGGLFVDNNANLFNTKSNCK